MLSDPGSLGLAILQDGSVLLGKPAVTVLEANIPLGDRRLQGTSRYPPYLPAAYRPLPADMNVCPDSAGQDAKTMTPDDLPATLLESDGAVFGLNQITLKSDHREELRFTREVEERRQAPG